MHERWPHSSRRLFFVDPPIVVVVVVLQGSFIAQLLHSFSMTLALRFLVRQFALLCWSFVVGAAAK